MELPVSFIMPDTYTQDLTYLTQGLLSGGSTGLVSQGMPVVLQPMPAADRDVRPVVAADQVQPGMGSVVLLPNTAVVRDVNGMIVPAFWNTVDAGGNQLLTFDKSGDGYLHLNSDSWVEGSPLGSNLGQLQNMYDGDFSSYTGSDIRVLLEIADTGAGVARCAKQLLELTTITVSVHRVKSPVSALGFINAKGFCRGRRTIAGTLVLTKFTADSLYRFLQAGVLQDTSKDTAYSKIDQLPPFNITLLCADEWGHAAYQRLLGVEFVTDGSVYSIQDMLSEQTISYLAADFTPLLPLTATSFYTADPADPTTHRDRVPTDLWPSPVH